MGTVKTKQSRQVQPITDEIHKEESTMRKTFALLLIILLCLPGASSLAEEAGEAEPETFTCEDYEYALPYTCTDANDWPNG